MRSPYRLSIYVLFIRWGDEVEVRQTATGFSRRVSVAEHRKLERYRGFVELDEDDAEWIELKVLVAPGADAAIVPRPGTEAALAADVARWYWEHEIESEREYTWMGVPIVKSGPDVMLYQELIVTKDVRRILELGAGDGGSLALFSMLLAGAGGGDVLGVDLDESRFRQPTTLGGVHCALRVGDARSIDLSTLGEFDLIVIDVGTVLNLQMELFDRFRPHLSNRGAISFDDAAGTPGFLDALDRAMLKVPGYCLERRMRHPLAKALVVRRMNVAGGSHDSFVD